MYRHHGAITDNLEARIACCFRCKAACVRISCRASHIEHAARLHDGCGPSGNRIPVELVPTDTGGDITRTREERECAKRADSVFGTDEYVLLGVPYSSEFGRSAA